jgi:hypothetical protein
LYLPGYANFRGSSDVNEPKILKIESKSQQKDDGIEPG